MATDSSNPMNSLVPIQDLPADLAVVRMHADMIQSMAVAHPRDKSKVMAEIKAEIEACPSFAAAVIYSKPVGTVFEVTCKCGRRYEINKYTDQIPCPKCGKWEPKESRKVQKLARNLSIRAAESVAEAYGFNEVSSEVEEIANDPNKVRVRAVFVDYAKGRIWRDSGFVSRCYKGRDGRMQTVPEDRFYGVVVKAEQSRRIREVILRSVPASLKLEMFDTAEKTAGKLLTDEEMTRILEKFSEKGVTLEQIEVRLGKTRKQGWTKRDRLELLACWNAIEQDEATVDEIFAGCEVIDVESTPLGTDGERTETSADDLMGAGSATEPVPTAPAQETRRRRPRPAAATPPSEPNAAATQSQTPPATPSSPAPAAASQQAPEVPGATEAIVERSKEWILVYRMLRQMKVKSDGNGVWEQADRMLTVQQEKDDMLLLIEQKMAQLPAATTPAPAANGGKLFS